MLEIFDRNRFKLAILQNAFNVIERVRINAVSNLEFTLPDNDPKNSYCQQFNLVRYNNDGEFYRLIGEKVEEEETGKRTYLCEHVIALLMDTSIPEFLNLGGIGKNTNTVINEILNRQNQKHWVLNECDFVRFFEYGLEKENLLSALFSVANRFTEQYQWVFNTKVYPYQFSLKIFDANRNPDFYIRQGENRIRLEKQAKSEFLCTRLYAYGAGEGVNQLNIASLNNNKKYLQSPQNYIDKYGLIEKVWTDRRYTNQQSLLEAAQVMLNELQDPYVEYETQVISNAKIGDVVQIVDSIKTYVVETEVFHDEIPKRTIKIANRPQDIAGSVADIADRQRIEMTYSQGATQVYAAQAADNADATTPLKIAFYVPNEMININMVNVKVRISRFRAYNTNVISGGSVKSSTDGGAELVTSRGGGQQTTTSGGGASSESGGGGTTLDGGGTTATSTSTSSINQSSTATSDAALSGAGMTSNASAQMSQTSDSGGSIYQATANNNQQTSNSSSITTTQNNQLTIGSVQMENDQTNIGKHNHGMQQGLWIMSQPTNNADRWRVSVQSVPANNVLITPGTSTVWEPSGAHNHGTHNHGMAHTHTIDGHTHTVNVIGHSHGFTIPAHSHGVPAHSHTILGHNHSVTIPGHSHNVTLYSHNHSMNQHTHYINAHSHSVQDHTHDVNIRAHRHDVDTTHNHDITPKISFFGNPSSFSLLINDVVRANINGLDAEMEITQYLINTQDRRIPRGQWITIGIQPDDLARVEVAYNIQGFCQSRGDTSV
ncbi:MAG: phage tail protein [Oscillospiraceae bacterium]|nr:phage tail protein [Oscillospiraceae bacterium]